jgi:16S rRNA (cytosine967-C5)-methyltransferase
VPARKGALRLLMAVLGRGTPLELALESALDGIPMANDRALARNLASTVLRWLPDLDALIDSATPKPLPEDARARMVLRIALAGWLKLGTPQHAAVATALPLVEGGPRRLVHGVLGNLMRRPATLPEVPHLPDLFAIRWAMDWGPDMAEAAAHSLAEEPATDLTLRNAADTGKWAAALGGVSLLPGHVRVPRDKALGPLPEWPGFAEGAWWVQDLAASLPARLLGAGPGETVLDLCAAPGGKTLQLAAAGASVTAVDVSEARLERVRDNLARTGLAATLVAGDALRWEPGQLFDRILLDAPCSATGIFRRHPDVLHLKGARDLTPLTLLQAALLRRAATWLKPGGKLVYATCSLDPREGERIAERVIAGLARAPFEADEVPLGLEATAEGWLRTLPGLRAEDGGMDGFFIARMRRI